MLRQLIKSSSTRAEERCDLCGEAIPLVHRHLLEVPSRQVLCVCRACTILFNRREASQGQYRLIPERRLALSSELIDDSQWAAFRIPVRMAFFVRDDTSGQAQSFYPSPLGAVESRLSPAAWTSLIDHSPILSTLESEVEALLVNRTLGESRNFLVPIDDCFRLVGIVRVNWRGLSGGQIVWREVDSFFAALREQTSERPHHR